MNAFQNDSIQNNDCWTIMTMLQDDDENNKQKTKLVQMLNDVITSRSKQFVIVCC